MVMPAVEVTGPPLAPYPFGILSGVTPAPSPDGNRWQAGVHWLTTGCGEVGVTFGPCTIEDAVAPLDPTVVCGVNTAAPPFVVYSYSDESVGGLPLEARYARARQVFDAGEQRGVEQMVWEALIDATTTEGAAATVTTAAEALALAELIIASRYGGTAVMHVNRATALRGAGANVLSASGSRLTTALGAQVIAGGGYDADSDAEAGEGLVIATGAMVLLRSELRNMGERIDTKTNNIAAMVDRTYVVGWDCAAVRVAYAPA